MNYKKVIKDLKERNDKLQEQYRVRDMRCIHLEYENEMLKSDFKAQHELTKKYAEENKQLKYNWNKLKQYIPCTIISIPFVFWYFGAITSQDTYSIKLVTLGFISALHIAVSVLFHLMKKDFEKFENKG